MSSHTTVSAKWGQPHTLFYIDSFDGVPLKCQLISSITLPAVLAGCWDVTSSHFQIGVPSSLLLGRKPLLPKDPSFGNKPQSRGWGLSASRLLFCSREPGGEALTRAPQRGLSGAGVTAEPHSGSHHKSRRATALPAPIRWWFELQEGLRAISGPGFSDQLLHLFRGFCFLKEGKVEQERERNQTVLKQKLLWIPFCRKCQDFTI